MEYQEIQYAAAGGAATITLNRPGKLNAWTARMEEEFNHAILHANADDAVRVLVLTGAGRGFCAGADMSLLSAAAEAGSSVSGHRRIDVDFASFAPEELRKRYVWLLATAKPIIAAINGPAVGLGFVIPLYCDIRIAAASARFSTIFARRGLIAEYGMAWMLPRIAGLSNTMDLLMTGRTFGAAEALRLGLVSQVIPDAEFAARTQELAIELASKVSPRSLRIMKRQVYDALRGSLPQAVDTSFDEMLASIECDDFKEGVRHFLEDRPPAFTGR